MKVELEILACELIQSMKGKREREREAEGESKDFGLSNKLGVIIY